MNKFSDKNTLKNVKEMCLFVLKCAFLKKDGCRSLGLRFHFNLTFQKRALRWSKI